MRAQGCEAAGYRLSGGILDYVCARHLYGNDRMLTAWVTPNHAVVVVIGSHDQSDDDVYALLLEALDLEVPEAERDKPPCCDEEGAPPADEGVSMDIADAIDRFARARRGRR